MSQHDSDRQDLEDYEETPTGKTKEQIPPGEGRRVKIVDVKYYRGKNGKKDFCIFIFEDGLKREATAIFNEDAKAESNAVLEHLNLAANVSLFTRLAERSTYVGRPLIADVEEDTYGNTGNSRAVRFWTERDYANREQSQLTTFGGYPIR
jgi:hypothetical protein